MEVIALAVAIVVLVALYKAWSRRRSRRAGRQPIKELLQECNGDEDLAARLVFKESELDDGIDTSEAARRALQRLRRDRR